jgi:hypothetical protein
MNLTLRKLAQANGVILDSLMLKVFCATLNQLPLEVHIHVATDHARSGTIAIHTLVRSSRVLKQFTQEDQEVPEEGRPRYIDQRFRRF